MDRNVISGDVMRVCAVSPPARVAWIETFGTVSMDVGGMSVATREGGVDRNIRQQRTAIASSRVATREGGVDRNVTSEYNYAFHLVATREGGVDRNTLWDEQTVRRLVATHEGGVDRNHPCPHSERRARRSPPARVAWIETRCQFCAQCWQNVATREGGVDRNCLPQRLRCLALVATREGGVDRNAVFAVCVPHQIRRHPRGWRG